MQTIKRRKSKQIFVGSVAVGGDAPISVQSMTNTNTLDIKQTVEQIKAIQSAGADIVRVSIPSIDAAYAFGEIKKQVDIPIVTDIHFDYKIAIASAKLGSNCLRINPGNIGNQDKIKEVVKAAQDLNIPIRIGVNAGSLDKDLLRKYKEPTAEAMVDSALRNIDYLDKLNFDNFKVSVKASNVFMTIDAYRALASQIEQPLHLGVTEAGSLTTGTIKSSIALGVLLLEGIGDTIRISLASDVKDEVKSAFEILKALNLRKKGVNLIACPSCSRQNFNVISVVNQLEAKLEDIQESIDVAVIGCIVNGPGEAKVADIGLTGGTPSNLIYKDSKIVDKISNENIVDYLESSIRAYIKNKKQT